MGGYSEDFWPICFLDRIREVSEEWECDLFLMPICYTPDEFDRKKKEIGTVSDALRYGI